MFTPADYVKWESHYFDGVCIDPPCTTESLCIVKLVNLATALPMCSAKEAVEHVRGLSIAWGDFCFFLLDDGSLHVGTFWGCTTEGRLLIDFLEGEPTSVQTTANTVQLGKYEWEISYDYS